MAPPSGGTRSKAPADSDPDALLAAADETVAEGARLQEVAKAALLEHFRQEDESRPYVEPSRRRRGRMKR
jgi:hypothetical protein